MDFVIQCHKTAASEYLRTNIFHLSNALNSFGDHLTRLANKGCDKIQRSKKNLTCTMEFVSWSRKRWNFKMHATLFTLFTETHKIVFLWGTDNRQNLWKLSIFWSSAKNQFKFNCISLGLKLAIRPFRLGCVESRQENRQVSLGVSEWRRLEFSLNDFRSES